MAYQIQYEKNGQMKRVMNGSRISIPKCVMAVVSCVLILLMVYAVGGDVFLDMLTPGDPKVTEAAFFAFIEDVRNGAGFSDAATAFCRQIIHDGIGA